MTIRNDETRTTSKMDDANKMQNRWQNSDNRNANGRNRALHNN